MIQNNSIISSRVERGPNSLVEVIMTGLQIITTNTEMASYVIRDGFIPNIKCVEQLYKSCVKLIENKDLKENFIKITLDGIKKYSWKNINKKYYYNIY